MRLVVVATSRPFLDSPSVRFGETVVAKLQQFGHQAELVRVPCDDASVESALRSAIAASMLRVRGVERIVAFDFPAYYAHHENKVVWLLDEPQTTIPPLLAQARANLDSRRLAGIRLYAASAAAAARVGNFGLTPPVLPVPETGDDDAWKKAVEALTA